MSKISLQFSLASLLTGLISFAVYFAILMYCNLANNKEERNHFRNSYPYQYYSSFKMNVRLFLYIVLTCSLLLQAMGIVLFISSQKFTIYQLIPCILYAIAYLSMLASNILSLSYYKKHLVFTLIGFFTFSLSCILTGVIPFVEGLTYDSMFYSKGCCISLIVIGSLLLLMLINPKLTSWAKMEKAEDNGTTYYIKPKINFLALYEWIYLFIMNITSIIFIINLFVTKSISM